MGKKEVRRIRTVTNSASILALGLWGANVHAAPPSQEEMWRIIQEQQKTIQELKSRLEQTDQKVQTTEQKVQKTEQKVEATTEAIEEKKGALSTAASWAERTRVGSYGELHYNNLENDTTGAEKDEVDFHRFVIYLGHEFNESVRFYSELEFEHAFLEATEVEAEDADGDGVIEEGEIEVERTPGEIELEQAWVEVDLLQNHSARAGIDLIPVGILNVTHEPPTFYGVERNPVETNIIPTTWREAAIGLHGEVLPGWRYALLGHSGLDVPTEGGNAFLIRRGRANVAKAPADDGAVTAQVRYTGFPGLEVGVAGQYQSDITQSDLDIDATLVEGHVDFRHGGWGLRGLAARWDLDEGDAATGPESGPSDGRDVQWGWYIEPSYRFSLASLTPVPGELGVFFRYNQWDNDAGDDTGSDQEQIDVGLNYWPHPQVVFKFDYQQQFGDKQTNDDDGFNLGVGYQFF